MAKYHINDDGNAGRCSAQKRCPFCGAKEHFSSGKEARSVYEKTMKKKLPKEWKAVKKAEKLFKEYEKDWDKLVSRGGNRKKLRNLEQDLYDAEADLADARAWAEDIRQDEGIRIGKASSKQSKKYKKIAKAERREDKEWARRNAWEKQFESKSKYQYGINPATGMPDVAGSHLPW